MKEVDENKLPACPCCGKLNSNQVKSLTNQVRYLVENKLPWYGWNDWIQKRPHNKYKKYKGTELENFLNEAFQQPQLYQLLYSGHFVWACDACIHEMMAIAADIEKQLFCDNPPYLAYLDKVRECESCRLEFVFKKEEQQFWYEELKFWVQSVPKLCVKCRKQKRNKDRLSYKLSELMKKLDKSNSQGLYEISELYYELGNIQKAKHYATLAAKLNNSK